MERRIWHEAYDSGVSPEMAFEEVTLTDNLDRAALDYGQRPALIFGNGTMTYAELKDQVERLATALVRLGVDPGTRVAIHMPNLPQFVISYYGVLRTGAIATPTNPLYTSREIEYQWTDAGADVAIVADYLFASRIAPIRRKLPIRALSVIQRSTI